MFKTRIEDLEEVLDEEEEALGEDDLETVAGEEEIFPDDVEVIWPKTTGEQSLLNMILKDDKRSFYDVLALLKYYHFKRMKLLEETRGLRRILRRYRQLQRSRSKNILIEKRIYRVLGFDDKQGFENALREAKLVEKELKKLRKMEYMLASRLYEVCEDRKTFSCTNCVYKAICIELLTAGRRSKHKKIRRWYRGK
ncbi:MAG: hypothetical protein J7L38_01630 [Thermoproteales archaeon]|nr:hypothetical protein [Thermoproteales archaeon]